MARSDDQNAHLREQLERSRKTYLRLRDAGYDKRGKLELRFAFRPTEMDRAFDLSGRLRDDTGYAVETMEVDGGAWVVRGTTRAVRIDAASLGRWVYWMCTTGYRHECWFDGWGTRLESS